MAVSYDIGIIDDIKVFSQLVGTDGGIAHQDGVFLLAVREGDGDV